MSLIVEAAPSGPSVPLFNPIAPAPRGPATGLPPAENLRVEVPLELVSFRAVSSAADLHRIAHLREEIALPAHVREAPAFARLEKKETRWGWSARSSVWAQ